MSRKISQCFINRFMKIKPLYREVLILTKIFQHRSYEVTMRYAHDVIIDNLSIKSKIYSYLSSLTCPCSSNVSAGRAWNKVKPKIVKSAKKVVTFSYQQSVKPIVRCCREKQANIGIKIDERYFIWSKCCIFDDALVK